MCLPKKVYDEKKTLSLKQEWPPGQKSMQIRTMNNNYELQSVISPTQFKTIALVIDNDSG